MSHIDDSGYMYVKRLLDKNNGDIVPLLSRSHYQESVCLEFKGDVFMPKDGERPDEPGRLTQDDYSWHILKAIIAFENSCGGCILLGVAESSDGENKGFPIPIELSDRTSRQPIGNNLKLRDIYMQNVKEVLSPKHDKVYKVWPNVSSAQKKQYRIKGDFWQFVELKACSYHDRFVLALLISPSPDKIFVSEDNNVSEIFYVRQKGDVGYNDPITQPSKIINYIRPHIDLISSYISNIPMPNSNFVGRIKELLELHELLSRVPRKIPVICAPAGTGKTELALQYAKIFSEEYREATIIIYAEGMSSLEEAILAICNIPSVVAHFDIDLNNISNPKQKCEEIMSKLQNQVRHDTLLLLDNVDHPEIFSSSEIEKYLSGPDEEKVHIFATTQINSLRVADFDSVIPYHLKGLGEDSCLLLERKRKFDNQDELLAAKKICDFVDGNAWALDVIGEQLKQQEVYFSNDYQDKYTELINQPFEALSSEDKCIKIKHGCLNPMVLYKPLLNRMTQDELIITQFAAIFCNPDYINELLLKDVYSFIKRTTTSNKQWKLLLAKLEQKGVFSFQEQVSYQTFSSNNNEDCIGRIGKIHRLTRLVFQNIQPELCKDCYLSYIKSMAQHHDFQDIDNVFNYIIENHNNLNPDDILASLAPERHQDYLFDFLSKLDITRNDYFVAEKRDKVISILKNKIPLCSSTTDKHFWKNYLYFIERFCHAEYIDEWLYATTGCFEKIAVLKYINTVGTFMKTLPHTSLLTSICYNQLGLVLWSTDMDLSNMFKNGGVNVDDFNLPHYEKYEEQIIALHIQAYEIVNNYFPEEFNRKSAYCYNISIGYHHVHDEANAKKWFIEAIKNLCSYYKITFSRFDEIMDLCDDISLFLINRRTNWLDNSYLQFFDNILTGCQLCIDSYKQYIAGRPQDCLQMLQNAVSYFNWGKAPERVIFDHNISITENLKQLSNVAFAKDIFRNVYTAPFFSKLIHKIYFSLSN